jgi:hypothetical protein
MNANVTSRTVTFNRDEIALETYSKNRVLNTYISPLQITQRDVTQAIAYGRALYQQHCASEMRAKMRLKHGLTFNCFGLVFGSRRTQIAGQSLANIITDDKYEKILNVEDVLPGDIIVYYESMQSIRSIVHVGVVIDAPTAQNLHMSLIISKWGNPGPEVIHPYNKCPYNHNFIDYFRFVPNY